MSVVYRVQYRKDDTHPWEFVSVTNYPDRGLAMDRLFEEVSNDPWFSHRIVKRDDAWDEDTIILGDVE